MGRYGSGGKERSDEEHLNDTKEEDLNPRLLVKP